MQRLSERERPENGWRCSTVSSPEKMAVPSSRARRRQGTPIVGPLCDRYRRHHSHEATGDATRSELAEVFFEHAREAAEDYVEMERCSRPDWWNDWTRDHESLMWMREHLDERKAWAKAIDLLWRFSDGETVDADALREALIRMSFRRHRAGTRRDRNEEHIFVKAAGIVRDRAELDRMSDARHDEIFEDYQ